METQKCGRHLSVEVLAPVVSVSDRWRESR